MGRYLLCVRGKPLRGAPVAVLVLSLTMPETPTVSLLMTAYAEHPPWLHEAVASVLDQRDCSFELIVVDDGSPEPVAERLGEFDDPRLRVLRVEHGGVSRARNAGIAAARGSYVRFLDSDDYFPPDSTAMLLALASGSEQAIACGATRWCRKDLSPIWDWPAGCPRDASRSYILLRCVPFLPSLLFPVPWSRQRALGSRAS